MTIYSTEGRSRPSSLARPFHLLDEEERKKVVKTKELWLDIAAKDRARRPRRSIGGSGHARARYQEMPQQPRQLARHGHKNRPLGFLRSAAPAKKQGGLKVALYAAATVQEESACGARLRAHTGITRTSVSLSDVRTPPTARPSTKRKKATIKLGGGPVIYRAEHEPARRRSAARGGDSSEMAVQLGRQRPARHRRPTRSSLPRRRGGRPHQHFQTAT